MAERAKIWTFKLGSADQGSIVVLLVNNDRSFIIRGKVRNKQEVIISNRFAHLAALCRTVTGVKVAGCISRIGHKGFIMSKKTNQ